MHIQCKKQHVKSNEKNTKAYISKHELNSKTNLVINIINKTKLNPSLMNTGYHFIIN